jgi:hypothetical protein
MSFIATISSLAIVSVVVSALVQWLKQTWGGNNKALIILASLSVIFGIAYFFASKQLWWPTLLADIGSILAIANAIYVVFVQWFETPATPAPVAPATETSQTSNTVV